MGTMGDGEVLGGVQHLGAKGGRGGGVLRVKGVWGSWGQRETEGSWGGIEFLGAKGGRGVLRGKDGTGGPGRQSEWGGMGGTEHLGAKRGGMGGPEVQRRDGGSWGHNPAACRPPSRGARAFWGEHCAVVPQRVWGGQF